MNIYWNELKSHRKSLLYWSIGIFLMVASGMAKYAAYSSSSQSINDLVADLPKSLKAVLGFNTLDLSKISGYYGMFYIYLLLMATIHAAMLGATIIAKEEREKTAEFLFAKPVSRNTIITAKLLAAFTNIVIFNLVSFISLIILMGKYNKAGEAVNGDIALTMVAMFILQILFMVIGSALAAVKKKPRSAASLATGVLLLTYMLSIAIDLNDRIERLKYFTPFKYIEAKNIMFGGGIEPIFVVISVILIAALSVVTYVFYQRRDLNV